MVEQMKKLLGLLAEALLKLGDATVGWIIVSIVDYRIDGMMGG